MPRQRIYKKKERKMWNQWNPKRMEEAIICVRINKLGYTRAANMFKVPRTTLRRLPASDLPPKDCVNMRTKTSNISFWKIYTRNYNSDRIFNVDEIGFSIHFIKKTNPTKESLVLLILDGHYSYTRNLDMMDIARKNYVTILSIPSYTIHKMQLLDHTFMGPFK
ncbi:hypothetical protein ALC53_04557 [Atta colombica]|uniref:HTH psq-type domain-containing protein n=1 Tax=Atta colombica TaxID=520822 RepID=A0A195BKL6_9HYME|nr:hypothetical protein ALC53_04557 [Atta colombica]